MIQGRLTARSAAIRGNGWKASAGFSIPGIKKSSEKMVRESRLHAAIRRMKYAKEDSTRVEPDDGGNDGQAITTTYSPGANDRD